MKVDWDNRAREEMRDSARFYERRRRGLGHRFREAVATTLDRVKRDPPSYEQVQDDIHRCQVPKFPFSLIYAIEEEEEILILAVAHHSRQPEYWEARIPDGDQD